uniref:Uncharacterized protein n=1 Tax=Micrurus paraensis TaxID=1970185 RepID=A0A2D4K556_9SAUR
MGLPNWELYYRAAVLIWTKDWINLNNKIILSLEKHDLQKGWHAFLWETEMKKQQYFHRHLIRDALLQNWIKIKKKHYLKIPIWLSPVDIIIHQNNLDLTKRLKYKDILDGNRNLKSMVELREQGMQVDWWAYLQLQHRHKKDNKEYGSNSNCLSPLYSPSASSQAASSSSHQPLGI